MGLGICSERRHGWADLPLLEHGVRVQVVRYDVLGSRGANVRKQGPDEDNIVPNRSKERANNCFKLF